MHTKNLIMGLIFLICVFSLTCSAKVETEKYGSDTNKNEADSSGKKENDLPNIEKNTSKTGVYQLKNADTHNEFNIEEMNGNRLRIEFYGSYIYEIKDEEMANTGDAKGFATLKNNTAQVCTRKYGRLQNDAHF